MKKLALRYLTQGLVYIDVPDNFENMSDDEKMETCNRSLDFKPDEELINGLSHHEGVIATINTLGDDFFTELKVEAIEMYEDDEYVDDVVTTKIWKSFAYEEE